MLINLNFEKFCSLFEICFTNINDRYMHTTTHYYLSNLAVSDLLVLLLGLPIETYIFWSAYPWPFGNVLCVLRCLAAETSTNASILTITGITNLL